MDAVASQSMLRCQGRSGIDFVRNGFGVVAIAELDGVKINVREWVAGIKSNHSEWPPAAGRPTLFRPIPE